MSFSITGIITLAVLGLPLFCVLGAIGLTGLHHSETPLAGALADVYALAGGKAVALSTIPLFTFAGYLMARAKTAERLVRMAKALLGWIPGGLALMTVWTCAFFTIFTGASGVTIVALGGLLLPELERSRYSRRFSIEVVTGSGAVGLLFPPALPLIVYAIVFGLNAGQANIEFSIERFFMAGIVPGLLMGLSLWITWAIVARNEGVVPPARKPVGELFSTFRRCGWALMLPVIILVGLRMGVFTPTEAGVVAAVYALFVSTVIYRGLKLSQLYGIFKKAAKTTAVVMFLVAAAMVSSWLITIADLPGKVVGMLEPFLGSPILLMVAIMLLVMVVGTAMDMTPTILILTPVLMPVVKAGGIDPIYFGVMFIMNNAIGLVTPPVGVVLNVVAGVGKMSMDTVTKGVIPFMIAQFIVMFAMVVFPWLVTGPARLFYGGH